MTIAELYSYYQQFPVVCTDTRKVTTDSIFFALKGGNFDGNQFAKDALEKGARYAVVDDPEVVKDERFLLVEDVLKALQALANHHRHTFEFPVLGITGSNGKTTTKELLREVLAKKFVVKATEGNLNNHIGVPLTLLSIGKDTEFAVVEMGANKPGDIAELCAIAEPDYGIITNIGRAHLEGFGSFEGVARTKSELYLHLLENGGTPFINGTNEHLSRMAIRFGERVVYYLSEGAFCKPTLISGSPFVTFLGENGTTVHTHLIGSYNFENIAAALCAGKYFEVPEADALKAIEEYVPANNRSQILKKGKATIILDAYNANPSSMKVAVETFAEMQGGPKTVILGDMFELGKESEEAHKELIDQVKACAFERAIFVGKEFFNAKEGGCNLAYFQTTEELENYLKLTPVEDGFVLVKGSRGMSLEKLFD